MLPPYSHLIPKYFYDFTSIYHNQKYSVNNLPVPFLLAEVQQIGVEELIRESIELQHRYGYEVGLLEHWFGDYEPYISVQDRINQEIKRQSSFPGYRGFYVSPPEDFDKPNAFDLYADSIRASLKGDKQLFLGDCDLIQAHLQNYKKNSPAIWALGGIIHTLLGRNLWRQRINDGRSSRYINFEES